MQIQFGPLTLECAKQNLLDYAETDPDNIMAVSSSAAVIDLLDKVDNNSFPVGLSRPWSEVRGEENCNDWGMQWDFAYRTTEDVNSSIIQMATPGVGFELGCDETALANQISFTQPQQGFPCGDAGSYDIPGQWRLKLYCYVDGADHHYVLEVYEALMIGEIEVEFLLEQAECVTAASCDIPADTDFVIAYAPYDADPARDIQIRTSNVWLPNGGPGPNVSELGMVRNQTGTLGRGRID